MFSTSKICSLVFIVFLLGEKINKKTRKDSQTNFCVEFRFQEPMEKISENDEEFGPTFWRPAEILSHRAAITECKLTLLIQKAAWPSIPRSKDGIRILKAFTNRIHSIILIVRLKFDSFSAQINAFYWFFFFQRCLSIKRKIRSASISNRSIRISMDSTRIPCSEIIFDRWAKIHSGTENQNERWTFSDDTNRRTDKCILITERTSLRTKFVRDA